MLSNTDPLLTFDEPAPQSEAGSVKSIKKTHFYVNLN